MFRLTTTLQGRALHVNENNQLSWLPCANVKWRGKSWWNLPTIFWDAIISGLAFPHPKSSQHAEPLSLDTVGKDTNSPSNVTKRWNSTTSCGEKEKHGHGADKDNNKQQPEKLNVEPSVELAHLFYCMLDTAQGPWRWATSWWSMDVLILNTPPQLHVVTRSWNESNCTSWTLEAYSFKSVVRPHSVDPLLGPGVDVLHHTLPVGRPLHGVVLLLFCWFCKGCQTSCFKLLLLVQLLLDHRLVVGQDVLHQVVGASESIFILDSWLQVDAFVVGILYQLQAHCWCHVG